MVVVQQECHQVVLPPSVRLAIVDHFLRRFHDETFACGLLMGHKNDFGGDLFVRSCYPFNAKSAEVARSFVELHRASHRKDQLIGWYASSKHADLSAVRAFVLKENSAAAGVQLVVDLDEGEGHGEVTTQIMTAFDAETGAASLSDISFVVECSVAAYNAAKILFEGVRETTGEFALADDGCDALCSDFVSPAAGKCSDLQQLHQFSQSILKTRLK